MKPTPTIHRAPEQRGLHLPYETEAIKTEHFAAFNEVMTDLKNEGVTAIIYQDKAELLKFALANE